MKTLLNIAPFCFVAGMIIPSANAVYKCVKLSSATRCTSSSTSYKQRATWAATCDGIPIKGVAVCASSGSYTIGHSSTTIMTSTTAANNKYCKCQITSPAVSRWITPGLCTDHSCMTSLTADTCSQWCGYMCASTLAGENGMQVYPEFMSAIFSNLSD